MQTGLVSSDGQITIPKEMRQQLGIKTGSIVNTVVVGQHIELYLNNESQPEIGFALLKTKKKAIPGDFDVSGLLNNDRD